MNNEKKYFFPITSADVCNCVTDDPFKNIIDKVKENENLELEEDDESFSHYHMYDQVRNNCDLCKKIYFMLKNMELDNEDDDDDDDKGGKKRKKKIKDFGFLEKPSYFNIQNIDSSKVERLGKKAIFDLINQNIFISANTITKDVIENTLRNYPDINNLEHEAVVKYIQDHAPFALKQQILKIHPYFSLSNLNKSFLEKQMDLLSTIYKSDSYQVCNLNSILISKQYRNLLSIDGFVQATISFGNNNDFIDPVIFCLFANKLTILDDLINSVDPFSVLSDMIVNKRISDDNKFIMFLKASDPSDFITGETKISSSEERLRHELYRLMFHNMIKMSVLNLRQGKWYSHVSGEISKIISKIHFKSYRTEEEKILSAVLSSIPFKPILATKANDPMTSVPEAVEFIEYDIMRNRMTNMKDALRLDNSVFNNVNYDPVSRRLCINKRSLVVEERNCAYLEDIRNIGPLLGNNLALNFLSKNISNNTALLANGTFFISIPRVMKKSMSRFFNSGSKNVVIDDPVEILDDINIGGDIFSLVGAVCCKTFENSGIYEICATKEYIGRYCYNKVDDGWVKYDPFNMSVPNLKNHVIERILMKSGFESIEDLKNGLSRDDLPFSTKQKIKNLSKNKFSINDFICSSAEAKDDISRYGTLLIYNSSLFDPILCDPCYG